MVKQKEKTENWRQKGRDEADHVGKKQIREGGQSEYQCLLCQIATIFDLKQNLLKNTSKFLLLWEKCHDLVVQSQQASASEKRKDGGIMTTGSRRTYLIKLHKNHVIGHDQITEYVSTSTVWKYLVPVNIFSPLPAVLVCGRKFCVRFLVIRRIAANTKVESTAKHRTRIVCRTKNRVLGVYIGWEKSMRILKSE